MMTVSKFVSQIRLINSFELRRRLMKSHSAMFQPCLGFNYSGQKCTAGLSADCCHIES